MSEPRVSVVIIGHRPALAVAAIASAHVQTYKNIEVLYKSHPELWPEKFNEAWAGASGTYLVFLPDDDTLLPTFVQRHVEAMEMVSADMAYSDFYVTGPLLLKWHLPPFTRGILRTTCVPYFTFMVRADFWRSIGGWHDIPHCDWDAGIRMLEAGANVVQLPNEYLWNRSHNPQSLSVLMTTGEFDAALFALKDAHADFFRGTV